MESNLYNNGCLETLFDIFIDNVLFDESFKHPMVGLTHIAQCQQQYSSDGNLRSILHDAYHQRVAVLLNLG